MKMINQFGKITIILFFLVVSISACKKDDKTDKQNSFAYNGVNYETPNAYLASYGANDTESADFDIYLASSNITKDANGRLTGTGDALYLDLNSPSLTELASGTYTWNIDRAPNTLVDGEVALAYNFNTWTGESIEVSGGTVKITKSDTSYEIDYTLVLINEKTVSGYYKGSLTEINSSFKK